jgi:uncharacterized protein (DUF486 family)
MSSTPTNPSLTQSQQTTNTVTPSLIGGILMIFASFGGFFAFLLHVAAAKLSYDKYQSVGWAILDFIFGSVYIPYYAFFLNTPTQQSTFGARRRR